MFKYLAIFFLLGSWAQAQEAETFHKQLKETVNLEMCTAIDHDYNEASNACVYCAHGTTYSPASQECEGALNVLGKCYGDDHFHAATKQCMYCAKDYEFDEVLRRCTPKGL